MKTKEERAAYDKQYYKDHAEENKKYKKQYRKDHAEERKQYRKDRKAQWLGFIKADRMKCQVCGYNKCFDALDSHHNNPAEKEFIISSLICKTFNKKNQQILLKELGKCSCLCKNCHAEFHANERKLQDES